MPSRTRSFPACGTATVSPSPCVAGLFRPQIYLTFGLTESEKSYILAHERQHIKNGDHIWKVLAWLIMCVHWFNAFLWPLFYRAFLSQVEDACDQRVLRQLGEDKKADYGQVLLTLSAGRAVPLVPQPQSPSARGHQKPGQSHPQVQKAHRRNLCLSAHRRRYSRSLPAHWPRTGRQRKTTDPLLAPLGPNRWRSERLWDLSNL